MNKKKSIANHERQIHEQKGHFKIAFRKFM